MDGWTLMKRISGEMSRKFIKNMVNIYFISVRVSRLVQKVPKSADRKMQNRYCSSANKHQETTSLLACSCHRGFAHVR